MYAIVSVCCKSIMAKIILICYIVAIMSISAMAVELNAQQRAVLKRSFAYSSKF